MFPRNARRPHLILIHWLAGFLLISPAHVHQRPENQLWIESVMKVKKRDRSKSNRENGAVQLATVAFSISADPPEGEGGLQAFFDALDDLVFVFEPEGRILFTNPAARNQLATPPPNWPTCPPWKYTRRSSGWRPPGSWPI
jgi:PAS domain-containing protein